MDRRSFLAFSGAALLPTSLAAAFPRLFHMTHYLYLPFEQVNPSERHALDTLARSGQDVKLLPLPTRLDQVGLLAPLLRGEVLPLYPPGLRGPDPECPPPEEDLARLMTRWS